LAEGEFALVKDKLEPALSLSGQPVKRGTMAHEHIIYMMLSEAAAQVGDVNALRQYSALLESLAARDEHRPYQAIAHRACGIAHRLEGELDQARIRLAQAQSLFEELGFRWQLGRTLAEMAELELALSDQASAQDHLSRALAEFEAMGAGPDAERTRAALAKLG
jgi:hypothetical protein